MFFLKERPAFSSTRDSDAGCAVTSFSAFSLAASSGIVRNGAAGTANTMPLLLNAVRAYATVGEMCDVLREVWGEYVEDAVI